MPVVRRAIWLASKWGLSCSSCSSPLGIKTRRGKRLWRTYQGGSKLLSATRGGGYSSRAVKCKREQGSRLALDLVLAGRTYASRPACA